MFIVKVQYVYYIQTHAKYTIVVINILQLDKILTNNHKNVIQIISIIF